MEAPPPSNCWYVTPSFTVTVWLAVPPAGPKAMAACCCRPRVTLRPPESDVVVSQMFTGSLAAWADGASTAAATRAAVTLTTVTPTPTSRREGRDTVDSFRAVHKRAGARALGAAKGLLTEWPRLPTADGVPLGGGGCNT